MPPEPLHMQHCVLPQERIATGFFSIFLIALDSGFSHVKFFTFQKLSMNLLIDRQESFFTATDCPVNHVCSGKHQSHTEPLFFLSVKKNSQHEFSIHGLCYQWWCWKWMGKNRSGNTYFHKYRSFVFKPLFLSYINSFEINLL